MHRRSLPIASPCVERFDQMRGEAAHRVCDRCEKTVHDLSAMTRVEAEYFLLQHEGQRPCVRYRTGSDGMLRFIPPPPRVAGPMVAVVASLMAACTGTLEADELVVPQEPTCEDVQGYTIPCVDPDEDWLDELEPGGLVTDMDPPPESDLLPQPDVEDVGELVVAEPGGEGCPLQQWDEVQPGEPVMGIMAEDISPRARRREKRRIAREYRSERRRKRLSRR